MALSELYERLFDPVFEQNTIAAAGCSGTDDDGGGRCCPLPKPEASAATAAQRTTSFAERCAATGSGVGGSGGGNASSALKRVDRELTALLSRSSREADGVDGAGSEAVKHLSKLPVYSGKCERKPGTVNAALFGLDLERNIASATGAEGDDRVRRAAYDLAMAEAHCKHAGAVRAAEYAVHVEPADHLAEEAARYGAQSFGSSSAAGAGSVVGGGRDAGDSPVVVVAYVGNTSVAEPEATADI